MKNFFRFALLIVVLAITIKGGWFIIALTIAGGPPLWIAITVFGAIFYFRFQSKKKQILGR